ncbi:MAG: TolC family protein, partial [Gemmatimonadota bacterium]
MNTRCICGLLAGVLIATAPHAWAQELTLESTVSMALGQHPALAAAHAGVARAQSGVRAARAGRLPSLALDANLTRFEEPMVVAPLHGFDARNPPLFDRTLMQGSLTLGYALFDAARGARVERAEALAAASRSVESAARMQVISEVARAYVRVRTARTALAAHEQRVVALERERNRARQLVEQGRAARVALLRADAASSAARAERVGAAADVEIAENELARQIGVPAEVVDTIRLRAVRAVARELPEASVLRGAAREAPELLRMAQQIEAADALRAEADGQLLPRVQVGGRYVEYASAASDPQGEWQAGVQLSYALLTGGTRQAARARAAAGVRSARAELELAERGVSEAIDRARAAYVSAR